MKNYYCGLIIIFICIGCSNLTFADGDDETDQIQRGTIVYQMPTLPCCKFNDRKNAPGWNPKECNPKCSPEDPPKN